MLKSRCSVEQKEKIWYNGEHIDMGKMILSLKNVYMILMTEDFPIYSESVIGREEPRPCLWNAGQQSRGIDLS